jgi:hypothetical protein
MDIHLFRLVAAHLSRFEQICVISTGRQERGRAGAHLDRPEKNRAGPRPCSEKRKSTKPYAELLLLIELRLCAGLSSQDLDRAVIGAAGRLAP